MRRHGSPNRDWVLTDEEIWVVWRAAEEAGSFGAVVRLALLTAQRREKLASMRWAESAGIQACVPLLGWQLTKQGTYGRSTPTLPDNSSSERTMQNNTCKNCFHRVIGGVHHRIDGKNDAVERPE